MKSRVLMLLCLLLLACGQAPLDGTEWSLISMDGEATLQGHPVTLYFRGETGGSAGCNSYGGKYEVDGNSLRFPEGISSTAMACASEDAMNQETEFLRALQQTETYRIAGDRLELMDARGQLILVFEKK